MTNIRAGVAATNVALRAHVSFTVGEAFNWFALHLENLSM